MVMVLAVVIAQLLIGLSRKWSAATLASSPMAAEAVVSTPVSPAGRLRSGELTAQPLARTSQVDESGLGTDGSTDRVAGAGAGSPSALDVDAEQAEPLNERDALGGWALEQIDYPWSEALPGWEITFEPERSGLYGLTLVDEQRIEIYVRDGQDPDLLVHVVAHEIGHAVDVTLNDGADRRRWQEARGIGSEPWWPGEAASDFATGAGDFAEGFAVWQAGPDHFRSTIGPVPTDAQLSLLAELAGP